MTGMATTGSGPPGQALSTSWSSPAGSSPPWSSCGSSSPQAALVLFYWVDRSVITRAVHEVRRPRAACGFAVPTVMGSCWPGRATRATGAVNRRPRRA
jgi:hypothetical protein